jgi:hypothetical protein
LFITWPSSVLAVALLISRWRFRFQWAEERHHNPELSVFVGLALLCLARSVSHHQVF